MVAAIGGEGGITSGKKLFVLSRETSLLLFLGQPRGFACFGFGVTEKYCLIPLTPTNASVVFALNGLSGGGIFCNRMLIVVCCNRMIIVDCDGSGGRQLLVAAPDNGLRYWHKGFLGGVRG